MLLQVYTKHSILFIIGDEVKEGDIRIVRFSYTPLWQGIVEIFLSGVWGTIYYYGVNYEEARVTCRQLGYHVYGMQWEKVTLSSKITLLEVAL